MRRKKENFIKRFKLPPRLSFFECPVPSRSSSNHTKGNGTMRRQDLTYVIKTNSKQSEFFREQRLLSVLNKIWKATLEFAIISCLQGGDGNQLQEEHRKEWNVCLLLGLLLLLLS